MKTDLVHWMVLPRGLGGGSWSTERRRLAMDSHFFLTVIFLLTIGIQLRLHVSYIRANYVRSGLLNE